jgi:hypothetical protein
MSAMRVPLSLPDLLRSAAFARAYALTAIAAAFLATAIDRVAGPTTLATVLTGLVVLGVSVLVLRRDELSVIGFAPTSLVAFLAWALISLSWALDGAHGRTLSSWLTIAAWTTVAITVAHIRDTLQIVRAVGDVLRWLLSASLAVEVLSGIIFDAPMARLGVQGLIAFGGPIQGLFGSRNLLGFVTLIALVTFMIEWRARSVPRHVAVYSIILAALLAAFSGSPTALVVAGFAVVAVMLLSLARRTERAARRRLNAVIASLAGVAILAIWILHRPIALFLANRSGFASRVELWTAIRVWIGQRPVTGWGFFGSWQGDPFPTNIVDITVKKQNESALSTYVDVVMQLGWVGLLLFCAFAALALSRAWLAGTDRRSVVYSWLPLMLVVLLVESVFESYTLTNVGWFLLVICSVRAGQERSWRTSIDATAPIPLPPQFRAPH